MSSTIMMPSNFSTFSLHFLIILRCFLKYHRIILKQNSSQQIIFFSFKHLKTRQIMIDLLRIQVKLWREIQTLINKYLNASKHAF